MTLSVRKALDVLCWTFLPRDKAMALYSAWYQRA